MNSVEEFINIYFEVCAEYQSLTFQTIRHNLFVRLNRSKIPRAKKSTLSYASRAIILDKTQLLA